MKRVSSIKYQVSIVLLLLFISCKTETNREAQSEISKQYTCPMHPQVVQDNPGTCPMCGMDLVEVAKSENTVSNDLMLSESQVKLANITTQKVSVKPVGQTLLINARIAANEDLIPWDWFIYEWIEGDDASWERSRGWALTFGLSAYAYYKTSNPVLAGIGKRAVSEVLSVNASSVP
jgi:hypothetical protein